MEFTYFEYGQVVFSTRRCLNIPSPSEVEASSRSLINTKQRVKCEATPLGGLVMVVENLVNHAHIDMDRQHYDQPKEK